ncbi:MAG: NfeD family protein [Eubacteriales bacterium]
MDSQLTIIIGWIIAIIVFALIEALTLGLTTIWFAIGAVVALIAAFFNVHLYIQFMLFLLSSLILLAFTRSVMIDYLKVGKTKTNLDSIIGSVGIVLENIEGYTVGKVKVNGQIWSALSQENHPIMKDVKVEICGIQGVKLMVKELKEE